MNMVTVRVKVMVRVKVRVRVWVRVRARVSEGSEERTILRIQELTNPRYAEYCYIMKCRHACMTADNEVQTCMTEDNEVQTAISADIFLSQGLLPVRAPPSYPYISSRTRTYTACSSCGCNPGSSRFVCCTVIIIDISMMIIIAMLV